MAALVPSKPPIQGGEPCCWRSSHSWNRFAPARPPRVTPQQARDALALALEINQAIQAHATRAGLL